MIFNNWAILLFLFQAVILVIIIFIFIKINNRNHQYYKIVHSDLLNLVPFKIDLEGNTVFFCDKLEVLNHKNKLSLFVFKSLINRKARLELELFFQNLLISNIPFSPTTLLLTFQLQNKKIVYDFSIDYYDDSKVLYGKMQSSTRYSHFRKSEIITHSNSNIVLKNDFVNSAIKIFDTKKQNKKFLYNVEYLILIKIKNFLNLGTVLSKTNIINMEQLLTEFTKILLGKNNTVICKYRDGQFLVYSCKNKINLLAFQKKLNKSIERRLIEKRGYLQIQTQIMVVWANFKVENSNIYQLYNKIIDYDSNALISNNFVDIKLKAEEISAFGLTSRYHFLYSQEVKDLFYLKIAPVYKVNNSKEPQCYYVKTELVKNEYYQNLQELTKNIQDAGLWWKIYEPLFLKAFDQYAKFVVKKDLIIPLLIVELENNTVLTQIINLVNKKQQTLFKDCQLIFEFHDNNISSITNWAKYDNIIKTLRNNSIKIAFSHEVNNIINYKLFSKFKPDLVIFTPNFIDKITFNFNKFINAIICLHYLNIIGVKNIMASGVDNVLEIFLLKNLDIKYLTGVFFENQQSLKLIDAIKYNSYWEWKKMHDKKGGK